MVKRKRLKKAILFFIVFATMWTIFIYLYTMYQNIDLSQSNYQVKRAVSTESLQTVDNAKENSKTVADMIEETTRGVVGISKLKNTGNSIFSNHDETELGLGTGMLVSSNGYILSNSHVTGEKYSNCYVTLESGNTFKGKVVWSDKDLDISIVKIEAKNLPYLKLGNSDQVRVGETVYAIGNPIGFEFRRTVTTGIISAKNRTIKLEEAEDSSYMSDLIQTDATINPGNSGGPLILPSGEVIGINTVKITSAEGIGFAIPINLIKSVVNSFINTGKFEEATIGIFAYDKEVIPYLDSNLNFEKGIYVVQITPNGPASKTDLKEGDIIHSIDGVEINTMNELRSYIYTKKPNDTVRLQVTRGKINKQIDITLGKK